MGKPTASLIQGFTSTFQKILQKQQQNSHQTLQNTKRGLIRKCSYLRRTYSVMFSTLHFNLDPLLFILHPEAWRGQWQKQL